MEKRTLLITTVNRPDVVARITGLLSARAAKLESIVGAPAVNPDLFRIRLVLSAEKDRMEQIVKQITKLVDTVKVVDITRDAESTDRRFLLLKVEAGRQGAGRTSFIRAMNASGLDLARPDLCLDLTDPKTQVGDYIEFLKPGRIARNFRPSRAIS